MLESANAQQNLGELTRGRTNSPVSYAEALENYRTHTDWWIVFDAFDLPDAVGSALWISERTGISDSIVAEAIEGLIVLGLVKRTSKGFEKIEHHIQIPQKDQSKAKWMDDHEVISRQILGHLNENAKGALRFASFVSNVEIITEMYEKIHQAILEADEKSKKLNRSKIDNVYLTTFTAVGAMPAKGTQHA